MTEALQAIKERLESGGVFLSPTALEKYMNLPDDMGELRPGNAIPVGYKKCGRCGHYKKFALYNQNSASKTNTTGNCKECQKNTSKAHYKSTAPDKPYLQRYQDTIEERRAYAKQRHAENKDELNAKHKEYMKTPQGQKVMKKAGKRRAKRMKNKGIPYTRALIIQRDCRGGEHPICYLCMMPITDTSGTAMHLDHLVPIALNGPDCFTNVACVHNTCNLSRPKDARDIGSGIISTIKELSEEFMDNNPSLFKG